MVKINLSQANTAYLSKQKDSNYAVSQADVSKNNEKKLTAALVGLSTLALAGVSICIAAKNGKINFNSFKKVANKKTNTKINEPILEKTTTTIKDVVLNKGKALKDGKNFTGKIEDNLKNGDKIILQYSNGKLIEAKRSGKVNFEKIYKTDSISGSEIVTKYENGQITKVTNIEELQKKVKEQQECLSKLLSQKHKTSLSEFRKKVAEIKYITAKQKTEIDETIARKQSFMRMPERPYTDEEKAEIIQRFYRLSDQDKAKWMSSKQNGFSDLHFYIASKFDYNDKINNIANIASNEEELARFAYLLENPCKNWRNKGRLLDNSNIEDVSKILKLDDDKFERSVELLNVGLTPSEVHKYGIGKEKINLLGLSKKEFDRFIEIRKSGLVYHDFKYEMPLLSCSEEEYKLALELAEKYCINNPADFISLTQEELDVVIDGIKKGCSNWDINVNKNRGVENLKKHIEDIFSRKAKTQQEWTQRFRQESMLISNPDDVQGNWLNNYIGGGGFPYVTPECEDLLFERECKRFDTGNCQPLGRWMNVEGVYKFIQDFPQEGEIYSPNRFQSFAKTLSGAEQFRGNNFSDTNLDMNVKFVVYPKDRLSKAYDIGFGKYGADEAIYKSNQQFKVLRKNWQTITTPEGSRNRLYVIEMEEV